MQATHPVWSAFGPWPAGHALHWLADASTTRGDAQSWHSTPNDENRPASHASHSVRLAFGASPALHARHVWKLSSTMFGAAHSTHSPVVEYSVPSQLTQPVRSAFGP